MNTKKTLYLNGVSFLQITIEEKEGKLVRSYAVTDPEMEVFVEATREEFKAQLLLLANIMRANKDNAELQSQYVELCLEVFDDEL